jgi:hypothetical protein
MMEDCSPVNEVVVGALVMVTLLSKIIDSPTSSDCKERV